ncbi:hypothetical protein K438DRAFT_1753981 [Mycena galopus ATCC 62051]|nr:hypothetical protein K438DRAFT_1753981 [Mycena galopus ATCC 62051]
MVGLRQALQAQISMDSHEIKYMRYGEDDPTLWPQQYTSKFHHLEAIVKRGAWQKISIMWWDPQQEDFERGNTIMCSLGKLVYSILCLLEEAACQLAGQCQTYCITVEVKGLSLVNWLKSLLRIDPVRRIFERICIHQRDYRVLGLIPWGIVIHGFIDGYSHLITGLRASDNNAADTVLELFLNAANVSATWGDHFIRLEVRYGLDINNVAHIWLLHLLGPINTQLTFFAELWNRHHIQIRNGANRSPTEMFVCDMYVNGVRGDQLPQEEEDLGKDKLEVYGINWQGLRDDNILHSQAQNNSTTEGSSSWVGHTGPPPDLSQVIVQPPVGTLTEEEATDLYNSFSHLIGSAEDGGRSRMIAVVDGKSRMTAVNGGQMKENAAIGWNNMILIAFDHD